MKYIIAIMIVLTVGCKFPVDYDVSVGSRWPGGMVPYCTSGSFSNEERITDSMREWEDAGNPTGIEFYPEPCGPGVLTIISSLEYKATIGYNETNVMYLDRLSMSTSSITHELGHVLGLLHEFQRYDAKYHVKDCATTGIDNIAQFDNPLYIEENLQFDYSSIMLYNACVSITSTPITYRYGPSDIDLAKIRAIYMDIYP